MYASRHTILWSFESGYCVGNTLLHCVPLRRKILLCCTANAEFKDTQSRVKFVFLCGAYAISQFQMAADQIYNVLEKHLKPLTFALYCDVSGILPILTSLTVSLKAVALDIYNCGVFDVKAYKENFRCVLDRFLKIAGLGRSVLKT